MTDQAASTGVESVRLERDGAVATLTLNRPAALNALDLSMMDALTDRMKTDLSAIDLFLLSSHLDPDRRIQLREGRILEATSNTIGQYILAVMGRADSTDYQPLHDYLERELAKPIRRPNASASGSPGS